jgi:hypothetical protein
MFWARFFFLSGRGVPRIANPFNRGSAPDRARDASTRPGSFKSGHAKLGGRKKGTPNLISIDHKKALCEAAYRVGNDGNGKDGVLGYLTWVATRDPTFFYVGIWARLLVLQQYDPPIRDEPRRTAKELNQSVRRFIGLSETNRTRSSVQTKQSRPFEWLRGGPNAQAGLVQDLMSLAVEDPKTFCRMWCAAFLVPPKNRRRGAK